MEKAIVSTGSMVFGKKTWNWEVTCIGAFPAGDDAKSFYSVKLFKTYDYQGKTSRDYALPLGDYGVKIVTELMQAAHADMNQKQAPVSEDGDDIAW